VISVLLNEAYFPDFPIPLYL